MIRNRRSVTRLTPTRSAVTHNGATRSALPRWIPVLAAALLVVSGCGDDNPAAPDAGGNGNGNGSSQGSELGGIWTVSRFAADGFDAIGAGMVATITFDVTGSSAPRFRGAAGTFTVEFQNDQLGFCDGEADCTGSGSFDVQDGLLRFNPDTQDEMTWTYWVDGTAMGMSGVTDGITLQVEAQRSGSL